MSTWQWIFARRWSDGYFFNASDACVRGGLRTPYGALVMAWIRRARHLRTPKTSTKMSIDNDTRRKAFHQHLWSSRQRSLYVVPSPLATRAGQTDRHYLTIIRCSTAVTIEPSLDVLKAWRTILYLALRESSFLANAFRSTLPVLFHLWKDMLTFF